MMRYTFWYGRTTVGDMQWLIEALQALKNDEWKSDTPVYFGGTHFNESSIREAAAVGLLDAFRTC
jgi:hypothetical protein